MQRRCHSVRRQRLRYMHQLPRIGWLYGNTQIPMFSDVRTSILFS
jgi:hypothetical protein